MSAPNGNFPILGAQDSGSVERAFEPASEQILEEALAQTYLPPEPPDQLYEILAQTLKFVESHLKKAE